MPDLPAKLDALVDLQEMCKVASAKGELNLTFQQSSMLSSTLKKYRSSLPHKDNRDGSVFAAMISRRTQHKRWKTVSRTFEKDGLDPARSHGSEENPR